jgi:hypothetical protein
MTKEMKIYYSQHQEGLLINIDRSKSKNGKNDSLDLIL